MKERGRWGEYKWGESGECHSELRGSFVVGHYEGVFIGFLVLFSSILVRGGCFCNFDCDFSRVRFVSALVLFPRRFM